MPIDSGTASAAATFVVPTLTCTGIGSDFSGVAVGIAVFNDADTRSGAEIDLECYGTQASYGRAVIINDLAREIPYFVNPGDTIEVIVKVSPAKTVASMRDLTAGWSWRMHGAGANATRTLVGARAIACAPDGCVPVPQFSDVEMTHANVDGASLQGASRSTLRAQTGRAEVKASPLSPTGKEFTLIWRSKCAPDVNNLC
jgi:hypothetical protein